MNTKMYSKISLMIISSLITALTMAYHQVPPPLDNSQMDFLKVHNDVRANVSQEANVQLEPLVWNHTVAIYAFHYAQNRSKDCKLEHSNGPYGENIAEGYPLSASDAVKFWASEKSYYDYKSNTCAQEQMCGHYTQIVWKNTTQVGCAQARCLNGWDFVICSYFPLGNYNGQRPY